MDIKKLNMLTDFYEFTMAQGYFQNGLNDREVYFEMFFRRVPDQGGYAIMAGVQQLVDYFKNIMFDDEDINFLRHKKIFTEEFLNYLGTFRFQCDVWSISEGTPIFPNEPIVVVKGPVIEAQFLETMILLTINHQSLIATKASRIVSAAQGREVLEFGARRAQGYDGALFGARAAFIGGCKGTSCTLAEKEFQIPSLGTMAHSWIQMFLTEEEAFRTYAKTYPDQCVLLIDTYDVLQSGLPNAIKVFQEEIVPRGFRPQGIRIDSGDIARLSKEARTILDEAGFNDCTIVASNALDEYRIRDLLQAGAKVDVFGVGERLITSWSEPVFGGVYKLVAVEEGTETIPKIKKSETIQKITNPGCKEVWRLFDISTNQAIADVVTQRGEKIDENRPYKVFDQNELNQSTTISNFFAKPLLNRLFDRGICVYESPQLTEIKQYCSEQIETIPYVVKRLDDCYQYPVYLSEALCESKKKLLTDLLSPG